MDIDDYQARVAETFQFKAWKRAIKNDHYSWPIRRSRRIGN